MNTLAIVGVGVVVVVGIGLEVLVGMCDVNNEEDKV